MFKSVIMMFAVFSMAALATPQSTGLPDGTVGLAAAKGRVVARRPLCPEGVQCVTNGTIVTLEFTGGCLDNLLPLTYATSTDRTEVFVHALLAVNKDSLVAFCSSLPVYKAEVSLINQYPPFKIHFMGTSETVNVN